MSKEAYCICTTSQDWDAYNRHWEGGYAIGWWDRCFVLMDVTKGVPEYPSLNTVQYSEESLRKNLNIQYSPSKKHYWNAHGNRNLIWFYAHLRMLNFYIKYPDFNYYWFFDDDVTCNEWRGFFEGFHHENDDFLAYYLFKNHGVSVQKDVLVIDSSMHSYENENCNWFHRFPGDGDKLSDDDELFGSFFAITRYSNQAMKWLLELSQHTPYRGYSEGFVPTELNLAGFKLGTIFDKANQSPFFGKDIEVKHKNQPITWQWL